MNLASRMRFVWENTIPRNAHLGLNGEESLMMERYTRYVTDKVNVNRKTVVDFGIGGGLLGKHIFTVAKPKLYIGYDIAERSLGIATANLEPWKDRVKLIHIKEHRWSFAEQKPNIIVSLACIIHIPTKLYLDNVLSEMNISGAGRLILEVRDKGRGIWIRPNAYESLKVPIQTCESPEPYVSKILTNYELIEKTTPTAEHGLQILWYRRKSA